MTAFNHQLEGSNPGRPWGSGFYAYAIALCILYTLVIVHTRIALLANASHDDGLYIALGRSLAEGKWLGAFNHLTLAKGPGYPAFLALSHWFGISVSLAHALFHCGTTLLFVVLCQRFIKSLLLSGLLLLLLLWHPIGFGGELSRILRDQIYHGQLLLFLFPFLYLLFCWHGTRSRFLLSALSGLLLAWLWLTREETAWIIPALVLLVVAAGFYAAREKRMSPFLTSLVALVSVFFAVQIAFGIANWRAYGKFVGVDFKEAQFQRALKMIHSVRSGNVRPFVSITREAREHVYAASPTFKSMAGYFEGPGANWIGSSCEAMPVSCGEIGSGWFMWALRDAAASQGQFSSPEKASRFFRQIADEISAACTGGRLQCAPQLIAEMPQWEWRDMAARLLPSYARALTLLVTPPDLNIGASAGIAEQIEESLRFLNYPLRQPTAQEAHTMANYRLSGWYYEAGPAWFSAYAIRPNGSPAEFDLQRQASPDLQKVFDQQAEQQRFTMRAHCGPNCVLHLEAGDGSRVSKTLRELIPGGFGLEIGKAHLHFDAVQLQINPAFAEGRAERFANRVRLTVASYYPLLWLPCLALGIGAFLVVSFQAGYAAWRNVCYILALTSWLLVLLRISLLVLIDVTSMPPLYGLYLAPAYYMAVSGAVLSCAAWAQLMGPVLLRSSNRELSQRPE